MGERMRTLLIAVGVFAVLQGMKEMLGYGPTLVVATAAFSFCIGALWGAGKFREEAND